MKFLVLYAILAVIIGSSTSFRLDYFEENIKEDRIFGGQTAKAGQFPYQVSLRGRKILPNRTVIMSHWCGGSIISDRWIVNAAHCMEGPRSKPSYWIVVVGAHHYRNDGQIYFLDRIVDYPTYYAWILQNDITLLRTNKTIEFNKFVLPIPLRNEFVGAGVTATASGWGFVQNYSEPTYLQLLNVNTLTNQDCWTHYNEVYRRYITNGTLCTFTQYGQGMCNGDSGSPLVSSGQLIGAVSWGWKCAAGKPNGFTRISIFLEWIRKVTGVVAV